MGKVPTLYQQLKFSAKIFFFNDSLISLTHIVKKSGLEEYTCMYVSCSRRHTCSVDLQQKYRSFRDFKALFQVPNCFMLCVEIESVLYAKNSVHCWTHSLASRLLIILEFLDILIEFQFKHSSYTLGLYNLIWQLWLLSDYFNNTVSIYKVCDIPFITHTSPWF